jgi:hypothetical protein
MFQNCDTFKRKCLLSSVHIIQADSNSCICNPHTIHCVTGLKDGTIQCVLYFRTHISFSTITLTSVFGTQHLSNRRTKIILKLFIPCISIKLFMCEVKNAHMACIILKYSLTLPPPHNVSAYNFAIFKEFARQV